MSEWQPTAHAPNPDFGEMTAKQRRASEYKLDRIVDKVVASIIILKSPEHLLREIYLAGLYHGSLSVRGWRQEDAHND